MHQRRVYYLRITEKAGDSLQYKKIGRIDSILTTEPENDRELREELIELRKRHRSIDEQIVELESSGALDQLTIKRLKKQKLLLKDRVNAIESRMTPDIIA